jgi:hypothetical protein
VSAWFHPFVQDSHDLNDAGFGSAVVNDVRGLSDGARTAYLPDMAQVQARDTRQEIPSRLRRGNTSPWWPTCRFSEHARKSGIKTWNESRFYLRTSSRSFSDVMSLCR